MHFLESEKGKTLEARLHSIPALNPRPEGKLQIYQNLAKQDLQIQSFWISHFSLNLSLRVSSLYDSFDDDDGLLRG